MWQIDLNGYDINSLELVTYDTKHTVVPFTLASKNQNLSRIRVFRWKLLGNFP